MKTSTRRSKSNSINRSEARKAVLEIKQARSDSGTARKSGSRSAKKASSSLIERYLGHFGVGSGSASTRKSSARKKSSSRKKRSARKASVAKNVRRAS